MSRPRRYFTRPPDGRLVWDLPLRLFHWTLLVAVLGAFVTRWLDAPFVLHEYFGGVVLVLVLFRVVWGFVGPTHARFGDFVRGPRAVYAALSTLTLRGHRPTAGHTAPGGWMILLLLALLGLQATLGLYANDEISESGPLLGYISQHLSHRLTGWHEVGATLILGAIGVHVAAVLYYRVVLRDDLVTPLVTGYKTGLPPDAAIGRERRGLALALLVALALALVALIISAPEPPLALM